MFRDIRWGVWRGNRLQRPKECEVGEILEGKGAMVCESVCMRILCLLLDVFVTCPFLSLSNVSPTLISSLFLPAAIQTFAPVLSSYRGCRYRHSCHCPGGDTFSLNIETKQSKTNILLLQLIWSCFPVREWSNSRSTKHTCKSCSEYICALFFFHFVTLYWKQPLMF